MQQPDSVLAKMVDQARQALLDIAQEQEIGQWEEAQAEGDRVLTHYFACTKPGYVGWRWAVTMSRVARSRVGTVCEMCLLPGPGALLAPDWVPWSDRLEPGDLGRSDVLPLRPDDPNLDQGYEASGDQDADELALWELGLGRPRVLSARGRAAAAKRWYRSVRGPAGARAVPGRKDQVCANCGYLMLLAGSLRTEFGVCANPWSPDDGTVVSLDHLCGAHSELDEPPTASAWPVTPPRVDELGLVQTTLNASSPDSGKADTPAEDGAATDAAGAGAAEKKTEVGDATDSAADAQAADAVTEAAAEPEQSTQATQQ